MTDPLPPALLPLAGGTDAASPGAALERLMAQPACAALRGWQEPHRAIAIRATVPAGRRRPCRLGAVGRGMLEATHHHFHRHNQAGR